jgi:hypothetical protein
VADKNFGRVLRTIGQYAAVPVDVLDDPRVSDLGVRIVAQLARRVNYGAWNTEGRVDMSYRMLAARVGKSRWHVMDAVKELVRLGYLAPPESLARGGMRFWFNTGWNDEDEAGYCDWMASGFTTSSQGGIVSSGFDSGAVYCDALEHGFPTVDPRDRWVRRAKDALANWMAKPLMRNRALKGQPPARVYVLAVREAVQRLSQASDLYTDAGQDTYRAALSRLAHNGPGRTDTDAAAAKLSGGLYTTALISSGPSTPLANVLTMMGKAPDALPIGGLYTTAVISSGPNKDALPQNDEEMDAELARRGLAIGGL